MNATTTTLGICPNCEASIPRYQRLITYQTDSGPATYAECPDCEDVVHPR